MTSNANQAHDTPNDPQQIKQAASNHKNVHSIDIIDVILNPCFLDHTVDIPEENEAIASFDVDAVERDGAAGIA
jgi:hypothetical protein